MAFSSAPSRVNGQVIDQTWFNLHKSNEDNLDSRLSSNFEARTLYLPIWFFGDANGITSFPFDGAFTTKITSDLLILDCELFVPKAGISGTLEIDLEYKNGGGAWTTIFTTKPSLAYSAGDLSTSTNGVVNSLFDEVDGGFFFRMNIEQSQINLRSFCALISAQQRSLTGV